MQQYKKHIIMVGIIVLVAGGLYAYNYAVNRMRQGLEELGQEVEQVLQVQNMDIMEAEENIILLGSEAQFLEVYEQVQPTCVVIEVGDYIGEGSIYRRNNNQVIIVAAKHLLQYGDKATINLAMEKIEATDVFLSEQFDCGFIKVELSDEQCKLLDCVPMKEDVVATYGTYLLTASKQDKGMEELVGSVLEPTYYAPEFNSTLIRQYCSVEPGMSGAGVFDQEGYYVGMLIGGYGEESVILSVEYIESEYLRLEQEMN